MLGIFRHKIPEPFFRGIIGGLIAGTLKDIPDIILTLVWHVKKISFWGYVGQMCLNTVPRNTLEHAIAFLIEVLFSLGIGVIYSLAVVPLAPTKHYLLRGTLYGTSCWFILISFLEVFKITPVLTKDIVTPVLTLTFSGLYGFLLGYMDRKWSPGGNSR